MLASDVLRNCDLVLQKVRCQVGQSCTLCMESAVDWFETGTFNSLKAFLLPAANVAW